MGKKIKLVLVWVAVNLICPNILQELKEMGESLGYEGENLRDFVKAQRDQQREERAAIRQKDKEECEYNLKLQTVQLEKEKAEALLEIERQKLERELKLKKEQSDNELKLKQAEHAHEMEMLELKAKSGVSTGGTDTIKPKGPKLPVFDEGKDEMQLFTQIRALCNCLTVETRGMGHSFECTFKK